MLLSDVDIREALGANDLLITPFDPARLQPASYDLTVGGEAVTSGGSIDVSKRGYVKVARGASAIVVTKERLRLGKSLAGHFGLRSKYAREGLVLLSGPQVDPGYEGILTATVFNAGPGDVVLGHQDSFMTIEFMLLKTVATSAYSGAYHGQSEIPSAERARIIERKRKSFDEIEDSLQRFEAMFNSLVYVLIPLAMAMIGAGIAVAVTLAATK